MTTTKTLTEQQIRTLRREAAEHGDIVQEVICDKALDALDYSDDVVDANGQPDYSGGGHSAAELRRIRDVLYTWDRDRCYQACADAINSARAMEE